MDTDTFTDLYRDAYVNVYRDDEDGQVTITGELTIAILGTEGDHMEHGMATNHEAEDEIRKRLARDLPELLARLEFDSEAGQFFAYAKTDEDGLTLAGYIAAIALGNEKAAPYESPHERRRRVLMQVTALDVDDVLGRQATKSDLHAVGEAVRHELIELRAQALERLRHHIGELGL